MTARIAVSAALATLLITAAAAAILTHVISSLVELDLSDMTAAITKPSYVEGAVYSTDDFDPSPEELAMWRQPRP